MRFRGWPPRYNLAPSQKAAVITGGGQRSLSFFQWGLAPRWAKDPKIGRKLINARGETAHQKPSFREAFQKRRCLVPADGFYEWQSQGKSKRPFHFHLAGQGLFAFAGLWETWAGPESELATFCILTTAPNALVARVHDRMPVILRPELEDAWLAEGPLPEQTRLAVLAPFPARDMASHPVSSRVNSPAQEGPELAQPASRQGYLF